MKPAGAMDMTHGPLLGKILLFSLPLMASNLLQLLFNTADIVVVGRWAGHQSLAAVGSTACIINLVINLLVGISVGVNVVIARYLGETGREEEISKALHTALLVGIVGGALLGLGGVLASGWMLDLISAPADVRPLALVYIRIYFIGTPFMMVYNYGAAALRAEGDTRRPLVFLTVSGVLNLVLNLFFVIDLRMDVAGVALATIIAQICSWIFGIRFINRHYTFLHIQPFRFHFHKHLFIQAMKLGIPSGIQQALFSVGIMVMQSLVNGYGSSFMAGFNGANKIDTFAFMPIQSFTTAITTYVGQNMGASRIDRVKKGTRAGLVLSVGCSLLIGGILYPLSG